MKIAFYSDPGHGWAAVPLATLANWGLIDRVSPYSYMYGQTVYLEEDLDLGHFLAEAKRRGVNVTFRERVAGRDQSTIRQYAHYSPTRARAALGFDPAPGAIGQFLGKGPVYKLVEKLHGRQGWRVTLADGRQDITYRATARQVANFVPLMGGAA